MGIHKPCVLVYKFFMIRLNRINNRSQQVHRSLNNQSDSFIIQMIHYNSQILNFSRLQLYNSQQIIEDSHIAIQVEHNEISEHQLNQCTHKQYLLHKTQLQQQVNRLINQQIYYAILKQSLLQ
ncbi:unnamed protein product [Paramecium octaurelia]|uniref:Uncharacterized protein n=1 Tax=Paramecium octaurelia TaxID=43137 RepID=A0A8S1WJJ2_PAROT|nr:unnamed protein product [Paramecium octaurelia]